MVKTVRISRYEIRKANQPNWYVYDKLRDAGFPIKVKRKKSLKRLCDLDFGKVVITGNYTQYDDDAGDYRVYEFEPVYTFNVKDLRCQLSKKFAHINKGEIND